MHSMTIKNQKYELTSYQNSLFYEIFPFAYLRRTSFGERDGYKASYTKIYGKEFLKIKKLCFDEES